PGSPLPASRSPLWHDGASGQFRRGRLMSGRLDGKVAVVLGASAEAGTGWAIAERFAGEGAKVVVAARREAPLRRLAERIGGIAQACDVADEKGIAALA